MNQKQQNRLSMGKAVRNALNADKAYWLKMKPFVKAYSDLDESLKGLDAAFVDQQLNPVGLTKDKDELSSTAVDMVSHIARNIQAFALDTNNNDIFTQVNHGKNRLLHLPDNEQLAALHAILHTADGLVSHAAEYNVTTGAIAAARDAVTKLGEALAAPRNVIVARSSITESIPEYEKQMRFALERLDKMIHNFDSVDAVFVHNYKHARLVVDSGIRHLQDLETPEVNE